MELVFRVEPAGGTKSPFREVLESFLSFWANSEKRKKGRFFGRSRVKRENAMNTMKGLFLVLSFFFS